MISALSTSLWLLWLALLITFLVTEGLSQNFVTIWLAVGSLAGLVVERWQLPFIWQFVSFTIVSLLCVIFLRPFCVRVLRSKTEPTNIAALLGQQALALSDIEPLNVGQAKIGGQIWSAIAREGCIIEQGNYGIICEIRGVKLILKPLNSGDSGIRNF